MELIQSIARLMLAEIAAGRIRAQVDDHPLWQEWVINGNFRVYHIRNRVWHVFHHGKFGEWEVEAEVPAYVQTVLARRWARDFGN